MARSTCKGEYFASCLNPRATSRSSKETGLIALMRKPPRDTRRLVDAIFIVNSTVDNNHEALPTKHAVAQQDRDNAVGTYNVGRSRSQHLRSPCSRFEASEQKRTANVIVVGILFSENPSTDRGCLPRHRSRHIAARRDCGRDPRCARYSRLPAPPLFQ